MKKVLVLSILGLFMLTSSCGEDNPQKEQSASVEPTKAETEQTTENPTYDPHRGEGKFTDITIEERLNSQMATDGKKVFDVKCSSCHKITDEKLVGPGWAGVTTRRQPSWIMNFITNPD